MTDKKGGVKEALKTVVSVTLVSFFCGLGFALGALSAAGYWLLVVRP